MANRIVKRSPKPMPQADEEILRHSWGRRKRRSKKMHKRAWKLLRRAGVFGKDAYKDCSWECYYNTPEIRVWDGPDYYGECSDHSIMMCIHYEIGYREYMQRDHLEEVPKIKNLTDAQAIRELTKQIKEGASWKNTN